MSITLANVGLTIPGQDQELTQWIARNIDIAEVPLWSYRAFPGPGLAPLTWPTIYRGPRRIRLGHFIWPNTASRWGYGFFLASAENATSLATLAYGSNGLGLNPLSLQFDSLDPSDPAYERMQCTVYMLPPLPVSALTPGVPFAGNNFNTNNPYIIYVVDQRYYWWNYSTELLNIPAAGSSWTSLFTKISNILRLTPPIQVSPIPTAYLNANPLLNMDYEVVPPFLDALAYNCGQRIFLDMISNQVYSQSFEDALATRSSSDLRFPFRTIRAGNYRYQAVL